MSYRIILVTKGDYHFYVAQKKLPLLPIWKSIEYFYKSDFEDMPGFFTRVCSDSSTALRVINEHKSKKNSFSTSKTVYIE